MRQCNIIMLCLFFYKQPSCYGFRLATCRVEILDFKQIFFLDLDFEHDAYEQHLTMI